MLISTRSYHNVFVLLEFVLQQQKCCCNLYVFSSYFLLQHVFFTFVVVAREHDMHANKNNFGQQLIRLEKLLKENNTHIRTHTHTHTY